MVFVGFIKKVCVFYDEEFKVYFTSGDGQFILYESEKEITNFVFSSKYEIKKIKNVRISDNPFFTI